MLTVGITGTNGKTSCSQWIAAALTALGTPCAIIGTLGIGMPGQLVHTGFTTPDAPQLQRSLAQLRDAGAQAVSHGSVVACAASGARERHGVRHRHVHESHAGPSRLSRHVRRLRSRQGATVRVAVADGCSRSIATMPPASACSKRCVASCARLHTVSKLRLKPRREPTRCCSPRTCERRRMAPRFI